MDECRIEEGVYRCPFCGFDYTHHGKIEIFGREEDSESPNHVTVERYNTKLDRDNGGNPSTRREGVLIQFWCEGCHRIHYLSIAQHKGITGVEILDKSESSNDFQF